MTRGRQHFGSNVPAPLYTWTTCWNCGIRESGPPAAIPFRPWIARVNVC